MKRNLKPLRRALVESAWKRAQAHGLPVPADQKDETVWERLMMPLENRIWKIKFPLIDLVQPKVLSTPIVDKITKKGVLKHLTLMDVSYLAWHRTRARIHSPVGNRVVRQVFYSLKRVIKDHALRPGGDEGRKDSHDTLINRF